MKRYFTLLLLLHLANLYPGFTSQTLISTSNAYSTLEALSDRSAIVTFDLLSKKTSLSDIRYISKLKNTELYRISVPGDTITCSSEQLFYDPVLKSWIAAKNITLKSHFLNAKKNIIPCIAIKKIKLDTPVIIYDIGLKKPHTFFVSQSQILTHNFIPIIIGASWAFGQGITLSGLGIGFGVLGIGLWQKMGKNKKVTFAQIQQECIQISAGGAPDPDDKDKYPHGKYHDAPYHHKNSKGIKSPAPSNGQNALDNSIRIKNTSVNRVGISEGEIVILHKTINNLYHGHVRTWAEIAKSPAMITVRNALIKNGLIDKFGNIL